MIKKIPTANMSKEDWAKLRSTTIGGSDAAAILGLNPYKSPYALWAEKTGKVIPEDISQKEAVRLGTDLEEYVAKRFTEATGKRYAGRTTPYSGTICPTPTPTTTGWSLGNGQD